MVKVKICGITNLADARSAIRAGASFLGFNFCPESPRYISRGKARAIARRLPRGIRKVGVFVDESRERIIQTVRSVGLDYVQLHGDESPAMAAELGRTARVIKAFRVRGGFRTAQLAQFGGSSAVLLDGFDRKKRGGTGKTFDWKIARRAGKKSRIFLAGGLDPENIADAIQTARPYAVDVCSGVESKPGKKDPQKIAALMHAVRGAKVRSR
jgi:phosphoribosylanthranilate isomerase